MRPDSILSHGKLLAAAALAATIFACQPDAGPAGLVGPMAASRSSAPSQEGLASPAWQGTAATLVMQANLPAVVAGRAYSLVGVAQYLAVRQAGGCKGDQDGGQETERGGRSGRASDRGAVAGASVVVLTYLFPTQAQPLEDMVTAQRSAGLERSQRAFARGEAIGRAVGGAIVTRARADGFTTPFAGTIPVGAGFWFSEANPPAVGGGSLAAAGPGRRITRSQSSPRSANPTSRPIPRGTAASLHRPRRC